jgi:carbamoyltransferase
MNILGISCFYHDSAAALLRDGELVAAAHEERFSRVRHDSAVPRQATSYCLEQAGLRLEDLDYLVFYDKPFIKFERILLTYLATFPRSLPSFSKAIPIWLKEKLWVPKSIERELGYSGELLFAEHHQSHAASAFLPSPFEEAAILTIDGVGEWATTTEGVGRGNHFELLHEVRFPHSLGLLYSAFTYYLGFRVNSAEYKVMGAAPYGEPRFVDTILEHLVDLRVLRLRLRAHHDQRPVREAVRRAPPGTGIGDGAVPLGHRRQRPEGDRGDRAAHREEPARAHRDEEPLHGWGRRAQLRRQRTPDPGGTLREPVGPARGGRRGGRAQYGDPEIREFLEGRGAPYETLSREEMLRETARLLEEEQAVVGWFQGRMEWGPRSLGSRSILADARNEENWKRVNLKIKFRESFRPFAPACLAEKADAWFDIDRESPYMLLVCAVREGAGIPAVTHVDGSARLQTVTRDAHPEFHDLLQAFDQRSGCPVLINTSFNVRGEPIVCTPEDAYLCFMRTDMDALVLGNQILLKKKQPELVESFDWRETYALD